MNKIGLHIGDRICMYRKAWGLTLQQLADMVHKSRASVSKYKNGEIALDVETLYEITRVLMASPEQLMGTQPALPKTAEIAFRIPAKSLFFQARRPYFCFYDGRYKRLKGGVIDIYERENAPGNYETTLSIGAVTPAGRSSEIYYIGEAIYSDMLIWFSFVDQCNALEEDLLYIFNPLEIRDSTVGLLCGISSVGLIPCAFKCLVTLAPQKHTENFKQQLLITRKGPRKRQKLNMLIVDNRELQSLSFLNCKITMQKPQ